LLRVEVSAGTSDRLVKALESGAQEFILSSVTGRLTARAVLRLNEAEPTTHAIGIGTLVVDWSRGTVACHHDQVSLSHTELRLLAALLEGEGKAVSRAELISRVWPNDALPTSERENALAVYVWSLRKRLAAIGAAQALITIRGFGYRIIS
jgi:two-component system response regulator MprA